MKDPVERVTRIGSNINRTLETITKMEGPNPGSIIGEGDLMNEDETILKFLFGTPDDNNLVKIQTKFQNAELVHAVKSQVSMQNIASYKIKRNSKTIKNIVQAIRSLRQEVSVTERQFKSHHDFLMTQFILSTNCLLLALVLSAIEAEINDLKISLDWLQTKLSTARLSSIRLKFTI